MTCWFTSGRAPSWTATYCVSYPTASTPFWTDCWRVWPPATTERTFGTPQARIRACIVGISCARATTMISSIQSLSEKASIVRTTTGTPQISSNCLSIPCMREAAPAAAMTAATRGFSSFRLKSMSATPFFMIAPGEEKFARILICPRARPGGGANPVLL